MVLFQSALTPRAVLSEPVSLVESVQVPRAVL
jgi:hypothetical protein